MVGCRFKSNCPLIGPGTIGAKDFRIKLMTSHRRRKEDIYVSKKEVKFIKNIIF